MDENQIEEKYGPLVKKYQDKIETLSTIVSNREEDLRVLDEKISRHQANTIDYQKQQILLVEILKDIELKIVIQGDVTREMNELVVKKERLNQECEALEKLVNSKKEYISDIESYPPKIILLQKEMEEFLDQHSLNKKNAEQELSEIKKEAQRIYESLGLIINKG